jgi:intraflagellar transport protein 56
VLCASDQNNGLAQAAAKHYKEAEETLLQVQSETYKQEYCYRAWLARCYIYNKKARYAYELYLKMEATTESFSLLQLIANDCYNVGAFFYAVKAFDVLERLDPDPSYVDGKKGACVVRKVKMNVFLIVYIFSYIEKFLRYLTFILN